MGRFLLDTINDVSVCFAFQLNVNKKKMCLIGPGVKNEEVRFLDSSDILTAMKV